MAKLQFHYEGEYEDGTTFTVTADQRDVSAWEQAEFGSDFTTAMEHRQFTFLRFTAWNALTRRGETKLTWDEFDRQCVEVAAPAGLVVGVDPTETDQSAED